MGLHRSPVTIYFEIRGSVLMSVLPINSYKILKSDFSQRDVTKCVPGGVCCSVSIILYVFTHDGITDKFHDHLFQNSWQCVNVSFPRKHTKYLKICFFLYAMWPNAFLVGDNVHILSFYLYWSAMASQRFPMTIYFQTRGSVVLSWRQFCPETHQKS